VDAVAKADCVSLAVDISCFSHCYYLSFIVYIIAQ
jgi:hypothetical protein